MKPRHTIGTAGLFALAMMLVALPAQAVQDAGQDPDQNQNQPQNQPQPRAQQTPQGRDSTANAANIASIWMIWVKDGQAQPFEAALKAHAAWRKNAGERFQWSIYQPVVGSDLGYYLIRSGEHTWRDIDANESWEQQQGAREFNNKAGQYVKRAEHYFAQTDTAHSHWIDKQDYRYFGVSSYRFKPGTRDAVDDVMDKVQKAVTAAKWPYSYEIATVIGGKGGLTVVDPMRSYAEMADPDPSLMSILTRSLGSKQRATQAMHRFGDSVESVKYTIYAYRPDLSTPSGNP